MIASIVVARIVDKAAYAHLAYADNIYGYLGLLGGLGLPNALLKFCQKGKQEKNKAYLRFAMRGSALYEILAALAVCMAVTVLPIPFPEARVYMWALLLYPLFEIVQKNLSIFARTQQENKLYAKAGVMQSVLLCVLNILLVLMMGALGLALSRYIAIGLTCVYLGVYARKTLGEVPASRLSREEKKSFVKMATALIIASAFSQMMPYNETFLVNNIIQDEVITANFKIAGLFPQLLMMFSSAVTVYFFTIVSQMTDWKAIRKKVIRIGLGNGIASLVLMGIGMLITPSLIRLLYGDKYLDAIPMTYMLWIMRGMNCAIRLVPINLLPAVGKTQFNMWTTILSCGVQVALDYFFMVNVGIIGVAWGATIVYALSGIAYWVYFLHVCRREIQEMKA